MEFIIIVKEQLKTLFLMLFFPGAKTRNSLEEKFP